METRGFILFLGLTAILVIELHAGLYNRDTLLRFEGKK